MIKIEDFTGTRWLTITSVKECPNKIIIKYKEKYSKSEKTISLVFDENGKYDFVRGTDKIHATRETIVQEINKVGFYSFAIWYESAKTIKAREKRIARGTEIKKLLKDTLKQGDVVERYGKTPNLGLSLIEIEKTSDYGVSGFYLFSSGKRSNEYTVVSWDYIKGIVEK